jgi:putative peptide zinc metalloprotease protein
VRFDGYYVLSDLIGVPDLFARVKPVMLSLMPWRPTQPKVAELKPTARWLVAGWVLIVVPALLLALGWMLWSLPVIVTSTWSSGVEQYDQLTGAWGSGDIPVVILSVISMVLLVLPLLGIVIVLWRIAESVAGALIRLLTRQPQANGYGRDQDRPGEHELGEPMSAVPIRANSAAAFTDAYMLPMRRPIASSGWQHAVYQASGHTIKPRPGAAERRRDERDERLRTPIVGTRRVVVMSRKGGVGKTTTTLALGSILATMRGDRVVAVDANPDAGNLAHRVATPNSRTITDVLRELDQIRSYADLKLYTAQAAESRLEVLASDDDPRIGMALARSDYHRLIQLLDQYYNLILLDTGTGILDSANQGLLAEADGLVLVLRPGLDGGRAAALTLDWLDEHDYSGLVQRAVVVINGVRPGVGAPLDPIRDHFEQRCGRVVCVPWDPALETGAQTVLSALRSDTQEALMEMAAAVADNFPETGVRR